MWVAALAYVALLAGLHLLAVWGLKRRVALRAAEGHRERMAARSQRLGQASVAVRQREARLHELADGIDVRGDLLMAARESLPELMQRYRDGLMHRHRIEERLPVLLGASFEAWIPGHRHRAMALLRDVSLQRQVFIFAHEPEPLGMERPVGTRKDRRVLIGKRRAEANGSTCVGWRGSTETLSGRLRDFIASHPAPDHDLTAAAPEELEHDGGFVDTALRLFSRVAGRISRFRRSRGEPATGDRLREEAERR